MNLITTAQLAKEWNISQRRVDVLCKEGRIEGAVMMGNLGLYQISHPNLRIGGDCVWRRSSKPSCGGKY